MNKKNLRKGFTTVELVIVIAVIAILATALIPTFGGLIDKANGTKDMNTARQLFNDILATDSLDGTLPANNTTWYICLVKTGANNDVVFKVENGQFVATALTSTEKQAIADSAIVYTEADSTGKSYTKLTTGLPTDTQ